MDTRPHWALAALLAVALSVLAMLVAFVVRVSFHQTPYFLLLPAVMIASWYGGRTGGLVATMSSVLLLAYYVLEPHYSFVARQWEDAAVLSLFALVALSIVMLTAGRREAIAQRERALIDAEEARQHAETSSRLKDQFLATLSHELRTPLNAVLGWTSLLITGRVEPEKTPAALASIQRNALAQKQLVDDLLDTSAIVSGRLRLDPGPVDLAEIAQSAIDAVRLSIDARGHRFTSQLRSVRTVGDATRLRQVIWNLLTNAVKFTPEGGIIDLAIETSDNEAQIIVRDNGRGIAADFLPHVFDPFRQADSSITRVSGGLGLGLALVRHLVEGHGGRVWVESDGPGQGAAFTVCLPIREPEATDATEAMVAAEATDGHAADAHRETQTGTDEGPTSPSEPATAAPSDEKPCEPPPGAVTPDGAGIDSGALAHGHTKG